MASQLADYSQASEASRISPPGPRGGRPKAKYGIYVPRIQQAFLQVWKPNKPVVGASENRLTIPPTSN